MWSVEVGLECQKLTGGLGRDGDVGEDYGVSACCDRTSRLYMTSGSVERGSACRTADFERLAVQQAAWGAVGRRCRVGSAGRARKASGAATVSGVGWCRNLCQAPSECVAGCLTVAPLLASVMQHSRAECATCQASLACILTAMPWAYELSCYERALAVMPAIRNACLDAKGAHSVR